MRKKTYSLTNPQKSIWLTEQYYNGTSINNICGTVFIHDTVDFKNLERAINLFVKNNDSFRIRLFLDESRTPKQYIANFSPMSFNLNVLPNLQSLHDLESICVSKKFNLFDHNLFDIQLFKFSDSTGGFITTASHIISDACTAGLVASKVINIYSSLLKGIDIVEDSSSYINYVHSEKEYFESDRFIKDKEFWDSTFDTIPEFGIIPSTRSMTHVSCAGKRKLFVFEKSLVTTINDFCKNNQISIFNFLMAIYSIYIGRVSNLTSLVLGTPILNRTTFIEKNTPGMFISTVPMKFDLNPDQKFIEYVKSIAFESLSIFRHQKYPYQNILEHIREKTPSQPNLYDILISYQNTRTNRNKAEIPYDVSWVFNDNVADSLQIHLFDMNDEGSLNVAYDYRIDKYTARNIVSSHKRILYLIEQVLKNSTVPIGELDIVSPSEKNILLNKFNNTFLTYDNKKTVIDYFEEQVTKTPKKVALISSSKSFTYEDLNKKVNQLAIFLKNNGLKQHDIVGILQHRSPEMIISIIATLKIGATYLPLDPEYPVDRINYILKDSNCKTLLVHNQTFNLINSRETKKINVTLDSETFSEDYAYNLNTEIDPSDLSYIIYTSGSTGNPKGVMINHQNLNNFVCSEKNLIDFDPNKIMVSITTICFDIFALELWCSLSSGLTVIVANDFEQVSPSLLKSLCTQYKVTMIQTTPSRYAAILSEDIDFFKNFKDILVGGEPFPRKLLKQLRAHSSANIYNMYGPTETTVWSTFKDLTKSSFITIGHPIGNTTCYILDKNKKLLPINIPGELYIGGDGVTNGYWNRPELTKEKFVNSPFKDNEVIYNTNDLAYFNDSGEIVHLGRTDFQVKIRGYRIELEEIQNKLLSFSGITDCIIIPKDNKFLICYYVADLEYSIDELSSFLLKSLPTYMVPSYFIKITSIPLTPNGKVNRALLPALSLEQKSITVSKSNTEKKLSHALKELLHIKSEVDINTPFIDLGLDSLGIIKIQTILLKYNFILTTQDFYRYPTISKLASRIDNDSSINNEKDSQIPPQFKHYPNELQGIGVDINEDILNNVFLTGANGFVGIHILHELIESTNNIVYCLVRGNNYEHSLNRLKNAYSFYFETDLTPIINNRIYVISGDVNLPNFGIDLSKFNSYINNFSTIIHSAAIVKHYGSFDDFQKINITGTQNIVKFAYAYSKRLIHISSVSVSGNYLVKQNNRNTDFSENSLYIGQHYSDNVYVKSKFEAEKIVLSYMEKGLTAQILRLGIISGRYSDGVFQNNIEQNAFYCKLKSMISLGCISEEMLPQSIEFTPIDSCSKIIVHLAKNSLCNNKIFNLYNNNLITVSSLVLLLKHFDYDIKVLSKEDFNNYLKEIVDNEGESLLGSIVNDITLDSDKLLNLNYDYTVNIKSNYTQQYLNLLNCNWPLIDDTYLEKVLKYMKHVKFI